MTISAGASAVIGVLAAAHDGDDLFGAGWVGGEMAALLRRPIGGRREAGESSGGEVGMTPPADERDEATLAYHPQRPRTRRARNVGACETAPVRSATCALIKAMLGRNGSSPRSRRVPARHSPHRPRSRVARPNHRDARRRAR